MKDVLATYNSFVQIAEDEQLPPDNTNFVEIAKRRLPYIKARVSDYEAKLTEDGKPKESSPNHHPMNFGASVEGLIWQYNHLKAKGYNPSDKLEHSISQLIEKMDTLTNLL